MMNYFKPLFTLALLLPAAVPLQAQSSLEKDYSFVMNVPSVVTIASSPAHYYVLSETEGMAVFRSGADSLQWLYSSAGMQRRGSKMIADIRFAYLFGDSRRLTVLDPTSLLGVYSSTELPARPLDVKRIGQRLYIALGDRGIGRLSLETPSAVDSGLVFAARSELEGQEIISLEGSDNQLFALGSAQQLFQFSVDGGNISLARTLNLPESLNNLFLSGQTLYGSDADGTIFKIGDNGDLSTLGSIGEEVIEVTAWKDWLIVKGITGRLWTSYKNQRPELWKKDGKAGNHIAISKNQLWLSEYGQIAKVTMGDSASAPRAEATAWAGADSGSTFGLEEIQNYTIPHSKPLLFPIRLKGNLPAGEVRFAYQSPDIKDAEIRGQSFYWEPSSEDIGSHAIQIVANTSDGRSSRTSFNINVRSFNAPPRFTPVRPVTIPAGEPFSLPVNAVDSDGINKDLLRFLGVNLPDGAEINESTGIVSWTPELRQTGENTFRVIATDQYGAASSVDITINVIDRDQQDISGS